MPDENPVPSFSTDQRVCEDRNGHPLWNPNVQAGGSTGPGEPMRIATGYWTVDCASAEDVTGLLTAEEGQLTLTELPCDQLALMRVDEAPCMRRSPSADRERWLKSMVRDESRQGGLLADRLDHLFRTVHPKDRGPYTPAEVAEGINKTVGDRTISSTYIWQLRTGRRDNPPQRHL